MDETLQEHEHGQNMVIFAVIMIVLVALAGLVIDGGFGLSKRRQAQNAADAGALAGAVAFCEGDLDLAQSQALDYAINRNKATTATVGLTDEEVVVTATVQHKTFLMSLFGTNVISPTASAAAGCYVPCNVTGVLPAAWLCKDIDPTEEEGCGIPYHDLEDPPPPNNQLIVIMDDVKTEGDACKDPVTGLPIDALNCDLNGDGVNELKAGGERSWLDLDGSGGGSSQLVDWVLHGYGGELRRHTWFAGQSGVANDVFQAVGDRVNTIVLLPVYDEVPCNGLPEFNCSDRYHTEDITIVSNGTSLMYYHVITFSAFLITCVESPGVPGSPDCPGKNAAQAANINPATGKSTIPENTKTIEGYFVKYNAGEGRCEGFDTGVHTIYLNH